MTPVRPTVLGLLAALVTPCLGADYYLSPDGSDDAPGTREQPWKTIAKANAALQPGDSAVFLAGEYPGAIAPVNSGTAGAPIVYRSAEPRKARIVPGQASDLVVLDTRAHVTIDGFYLEGENRARWLRAQRGDHLTIRGCQMRRLGSPISIRYCTQVRLLDNLFSADRVAGDMMWLEECSQVLVEGNSFTRIGHSPFTLNYCNDTVVRANVFHAEWGRNYITYSLGRFLMEGNIITRARDSAGSAESDAHSFWTDGIFRHNRIYDNLWVPLNMRTYIWQGVSPTGQFRGPFASINCRVYHNTAVDSLGEVWSLAGIDASANVFQNNIFYRNDPLGGNVQVWYREGISLDNRFVSNLMRGTEPGQKVVRYRDSYWTVEEANAGTPTIGGFWSQFHNNIDAEPDFLDVDNRDYRLGPASEAIDAGEPLARAVGTGSGRALPVNDGVPFYDGFGIEGEEGDVIAVGRADNLAQVQRVELRYHQPAILHLDREVTWEDGMPVSLPWAGGAPDIGAYERGGSHPTRVIAVAKPVLARPGQAVQFILDPLGKQVTSVTWDFGDGGSANEVETAHAYATAGDYPVRVRATFPDGRRGIDVAFVRVEEPIDPAAPLVMADFEDATRETVWGWHLKFYRGHQTGAEYVPRPEGEGKCVHVFRKEGQANQTAGQCAPGAWDIDRYPLIRFAYRIPPGVPVGIEVRQFPAPDRAGIFTLGGTITRERRAPDLDACTLIDDGQWHEITVDVRTARQADPELQYLRQFMFWCNWREDQGQEFWLDDFAILPE
ncbi:MAG: right-handed parallel beta-helix repeat-containing protein [Armatimonadota bacterium]